MNSKATLFKAWHGYQESGRGYQHSFQKIVIQKIYKYYSTLLLSNWIIDGLNACIFKVEIIIKLLSRFSEQRLDKYEVI